MNRVHGQAAFGRGVGDHDLRRSIGTYVYCPCRHWSHLSPTQVLWVAVAEGLDIIPAEILSNPARFDGKVVTRMGQVTALRETVSRTAIPIAHSDLLVGRQSMKVFSFGLSIP